MRTKNILIAITLVMVVPGLFFSNPVFAGKLPAGTDKADPALELSQDQEIRLLDEYEVFEGEMIRLDAKWAIAQNRKNRAMAGRDIGFDKLRAQEKVILEVVEAMRSAHIDAMATIKEILTPAQWADYVSRVNRMVMAPPTLPHDRWLAPCWEEFRREGCDLELSEEEAYDMEAYLADIDSDPFYLLFN